MSERANSRDRRSRRHHRNRPRHQASNRTTSVTQTATATHQTSQGHNTGATTNESTSVHASSMPQTVPIMSYTTPAHWPGQPAMTNNGLDSQYYTPAWPQDISSLQYLSAPDASAEVNQTSHFNHGYDRNDQVQWSAIHNYANAPPRDDAWSPWVIPLQDGNAEERTEMEDNQAEDYGEHSAPNGA
ncbi:hypothetical protein PG995_014505 [Apiospora arundinis]